MMTEQQIKFFNRVAIKMVPGMDMETAMKAVLADDRAAIAKVQGMGSYDRAAFDQKLSKQVFASIHMREALAA